MEYSTVIMVVVVLGWLTWLIVYSVNRKPSEFKKMMTLFERLREFIPLTALAKALQKWAEKTRGD